MTVAIQLPGTRMSGLAFLFTVVLAGCGGDGGNGPGSDAPAPDAPGTDAPDPPAIDHVDIETAAAHVRISVPAPATFRVQLSQRADFPAVASFAVDPAVLAPGAAFRVDESDPAVVVVRSAGGALRITRDPLHLALLDASGNVVAEEAAPIAWSEQGATIAWKLREGEHVYGLGDKTGGLDRRGHQYRMWNYDHYGWTTTGAESDPLYKSIPSLVFLKDGRSHGLFIDNTSRAVVDVGATDAGQLTYQAERASTMDLYLFADPDPRHVLGAFADLTGHAPLPPRWSLGHHQSRYSYMSELDARDVASRLRADLIPTDAIWLDIDYQDNYAPFSVNATTFPNFAGMIGDFAAAGLNTVLITDLHIRQKDSDTQFQSGAAGDHFLHSAAGPLFADYVWPGHAAERYLSVFPEFTRASTRAWWGSLYQTFVGYGVAGFWNDMNEPAVFTFDTVPDDFSKTLPDDVPHRLDDGTTADHVAIHNVYGLLNARATYEGQLTLRPNTRPFVLTRAAYAGSQRWGATWTGDNTASRDHLAITIPQLLNLGASGYAFAGADVGGYSGCPYTDTNSELFTEWMELGALQPFLRNHSEFGTCRREPWLLGADVEARIRRAIERRYKLLPYLYTAFEESSRLGVPVMRPLWLEFPDDATAATNETAYLLGRDLLIAPKLVEGSAPYQVALPAARWWDTTTGLPVDQGGVVTITPTPDDSIRIFARAGAIVPSQPLVQSASEVPHGALTVDVWPGEGEDCRGAIYLDDGKSLDYQSGKLGRVNFVCQPFTDRIKVGAIASGTFEHWWSSTQVVIHGAQEPASVIGVNGAELPWSFNPDTHALTVTIDGNSGDWFINAIWVKFAVAPSAGVKQ